MPYVNGVFQLLPGSYGGPPNTPIKSTPYNAQLDDFVNAHNTARPVTAGGTGATNAADARTNLGVGSAGRQAYEKGAWTPAVTFSGNPAGVTYSNRFGYYIRIGKLIYVYGEVNMTNKGVQGGGAAINGLPWAVENGTQPAAISGYNNMVNTTFMAGQVQSNQIVVTINTTTGIEQAAWDRFTNTSFLRFSAVYQGAATDV